MSKKNKIEPSGANNYQVYKTKGSFDNEVIEIGLTYKAANKMALKLLDAEPEGSEVGYGVEPMTKMAEGGAIDGAINWQNFTLNQLAKFLRGYNDISINTFAPKGADYSTKIDYQKYGNNILSIGDQGKEVSIQRGSENMYLNITVYGEDKQPPFIIGLYTKENHAGIKELQNSIVETFEAGGAIDGKSGGQTVREYFKALNEKILPEKAGMYLHTQILSDPDIDLVETDDEDFLEIKQLIEEEFPTAVKAPSKPAEAELSKQDYLDALEGAKVALEYAEKSEKTDLNDYIDGLEIAIEML